MKRFKILSFTIALLIIVSCAEEKKFDPLKWKNWTETESSLGLRWEMHKSLLKEYHLIGYTKKQVIDLLGNPNDENNGEYYYSLGYTQNGIDTGTLIIKFKNDKAVKIDIIRG